MIGLRSVAVIALLSLAASVRAQPIDPEGLTVTASVDRPAIWVADRLTYTIEIVCPRGVDILTGDLDRDKLKLTGLEVVGADSHRQEDGGVRRYAFVYVLTTYRVDVATLAIESLPVRYYLTRAGQRAEEAVPAGSIVVPAVAVAFRSLLPDDQPIYAVRDGRSVPPRWLPYGALDPVGIGLILLSVTPAMFLLIRLAHGTRARWRAGSWRSSRRAAQSARPALEELRGLEPVDAAARREAFARLEALMRQHVADRCGVAAAGLTPEEINAALEPCATRIPVELVTSILRACELARYADPERRPSLDGWREATTQAGQVLGDR
jgi:hypothetical protein